MPLAVAGRSARAECFLLTTHYSGLNTQFATHLPQGWIGAKFLNSVHLGRLKRFQSAKSFLVVADRNSYVLAHLSLPKQPQS